MISITASREESMSTAGWIQTSDYSSTELGTVSFEQAAHAILSFPWAERLREFTERVLRKEDACPPGVGFNSEEEDCFHVYAVAHDEWQLYVSLSRPRKILGLFRQPSKLLYMEVKTLEHAVELLRLFFDRERERLATEAEKHPSREAISPRLG
jgi:hypothetical protein